MVCIAYEGSLTSMQGLEAQASDEKDNNDNHKNKQDDKPRTDESTRPSYGKEKPRDYRDSLYYLYQDGADVRELPVIRHGSRRFNQYKSVPHWQNGSPTQQHITVNNDIYLRPSATSTDTYHSKDRHRHPSNSQEISLPGGRTIINNSIFVDISSSSDSEAEDAGWRSNRKGGGQQREQKTRDNYNSQDAIRVLVNPQSPQDVSLSADAGITDDFEEPLEEYSRLWRLGQFEAARTLFDQCLLDLIENPYVLEQHGQCLLEMLDYNTLAQLAKEFPPRPAEGAVQTSWYLLLRRAEVSCELDFPTVQVLKNAIYLDDNSLMSMSAQDLNGLYLHLKAEERIWEFRDLFHECLAAYGLKEIFRMMFGEKDEKGSRWEVDIVQTICDDWSAAVEDEAVSFAFLDIFTTIALASMAQPDNSRTASRYFEYTSAKPVGLAALRNRLRMLPGKVRISRRVFPHQNIPMYAPVEDESPEWRPNSTPDTEENSVVIRMVLKTAQKICDTELQAACIQELIYISPAPEELLDELSSLWKSVGNLRRHNQTHLYRYLCIPASPPEPREKLRQDILLSGEFSSAGFSQYAQYMVLRALSSRLHEKSAYSKRARSLQQALDEDDSNMSAEQSAKPGPQGRYKETESSGQLRHDSARSYSAAPRRQESRQIAGTKSESYYTDRRISREFNSRYDKKASGQEKSHNARTVGDKGTRSNRDPANPTFADLPRPRSEIIPASVVNLAQASDSSKAGGNETVGRDGHGGEDRGRTRTGEDRAVDRAVEDGDDGGGGGVPLTGQQEGKDKKQ
ncbi:tetratricopeptide repeat domain-containing protein [Colletotrichum asianum]